MNAMGMNRDINQSGDGRRAAHVKWDGKTIALGTFSAAEAVDKCERAKSLTKKWRATMVPKPDVEWVKKALERLNIRVVNDRPGRRRKDEVMEKDKLNKSNELQSSNLMGDDQAFLSMGRANPNDSSGLFSPLQQGFPTGMPTSSNENVMQSMNSFGMSSLGGNSGHARMSSGSIGGGLSSNNMARRFSNESVPGMASLNAMSMRNSNFDSNSMGRTPYQQGRMPFPLGPGGQIPGMESPASSRQHYGVLKEHHDNLIKELQQTTHMMQMYQRNYTDQTDQQQAVNNYMNTSGYGSTTGGSMTGQRRDPFALRQEQGRQNQAYGNSMQYPYDVPDRRNSLGLADAALSQRTSMQNPFMVGSSGNTGLQGGMQVQNSNMMQSGLDRLQYSGLSPNQNLQSQYNTSQRSSGNKRKKTDRTSGEGVSESVSGFSTKQEEV